MYRPEAGPFKKALDSGLCPGCLVKLPVDKHCLCCGLVVVDEKEIRKNMTKNKQEAANEQTHSTA